MKKKRKISKKGLAAIRKAQKARWAKVHATTDQIVGTSSSGQGITANIFVPRNVAEEVMKQATGKKSGALSSKQATFYHDVPPELFRRIGRRHTVGHVKYTPGITMNLNWRTGLDDPHYVMDRLNHLYEHAFAFLDDGDSLDDNLAAIVWCCGFLMEVERVAPHVLEQVLGQSKFFGKRADEQKKHLETIQCK